MLPEKRTMACTARYGFALQVPLLMDVSRVVNPAGAVRLISHGRTPDPNVRVLCGRCYRDATEHMSVRPKVQLRGEGLLHRAGGTLSGLTILILHQASWF